VTTPVLAIGVAVNPAAACAGADGVPANNRSPPSTDNDISNFRMELSTFGIHPSDASLREVLTPEAPPRFREKFEGRSARSHTTRKIEADMYEQPMNVKARSFLIAAQ
jgi:hypothetical protein